MFSDLLYYHLGSGVEAFSTRRDSILPYPVIQGHQVHGSEVAIIDRSDLTREDLEGYDAFITELPGVAIGVRTADCVPILISDPRNRVIAAIHSGWKGTVQKIALKTIGVMETRFKTRPEDLVAVIGPSIGPASFQVGEKVAAKFKEAGFPMDAIWSFQGQGDGRPMSGGHHIDLWGALVVPYMKRLGGITGDRHWTVRADLLWANAIQNIAPAEGTVIHGRPRQAGAQNEAYFHCHWGDSHAPGVFNEWLVAWPEAFCWNTAEWMRKKTEKN